MEHVLNCIGLLPSHTIEHAIGVHPTVRRKVKLTGVAVEYPTVYPIPRDAEVTYKFYVNDLYTGIKFKHPFDTREKVSGKLVSYYEEYKKGQPA